MCCDVSPIVVVSPNEATSLLLSKTLKLSCAKTTLSLLFVVFLIVIVPPSKMVFAPNDATALLLSDITKLSSVKINLSLLLSELLNVIVPPVSVTSEPNTEDV